jgi:hypothetical protein
VALFAALFAAFVSADVLTPSSARRRRPVGNCLNRKDSYLYY